MNKREQRRQIEKELTERIAETIVWQKKPYTAVKVWACYGKGNSVVRYVEIAFTKVCWPDKWNAEYGVELATCKAIADISRRIVGNSEASSQ